MKVRLLRGQVVVREDKDAEFRHLCILVPGPSTKHDKDAVPRSRAWHKGTVLAMGEPMRTEKGVEVEPGFDVGDTVFFHFDHHEKSWTRPWVDGEEAVWVPQWCVDAVEEQ